MSHINIRSPAVTPRETSWSTLANNRSETDHFNLGDEAKDFDEQASCSKDMEEDPFESTRRRMLISTQIRRASIKPIRIISLSDRMMPGVPFPLLTKLTREEAFEKSGLPNLHILREHLEREGRLELNVISEIVHRASELLAKDHNLIRLNGTVTVVGSLSGHFYDLMTVWDTIQPISRSQCLFLGSYVNNGNFGVEVVIFLFALKISYPKHIFLLRGCHDCRHLSRNEFKFECETKYTIDVFHSIMSAFDFLSLAALVNDKILCLHGGISPLLRTLDDIEKIYRFREPPFKGPMTDLLWADPLPNYGIEPSSTPFYSLNDEREVSVYFSSQALYEFVKRNDLMAVIRTHQPLMEGFHFYPARDVEIGKYIALVSLHSAPNFQGRRNKGAMISLTPDALAIRQFLWSPEPYWLPLFMDAFSWSLPYVIEKVTLMIADLFELVDHPNYVEEMKEAQLKQEMYQKTYENMMKGQGFKKASHDHSVRTASNLSFDSEASERREKALALARRKKMERMRQARVVPLFQAFHRLQKQNGSKNLANRSTDTKFARMTIGAYLKMKDYIHSQAIPAQEVKGRTKLDAGLDSRFNSEARFKIDKWLKSDS